MFWKGMSLKPILTSFGQKQHGWKLHPSMFKSQLGNQRRTGQRLRVIGCLDTLAILDRHSREMKKSKGSGRNEAKE